MSRKMWFSLNQRYVSRCHLPSKNKGRRPVQMGVKRHRTVLPCKSQRTIRVKINPVHPTFQSRSQQFTRAKKQIVAFAVFVVPKKHILVIAYQYQLIAENILSKTEQTTRQKRLPLLFPHAFVVPSTYPAFGP